MTDRIEYCVVGCTLRGSHRDGCDDDACKGCAPRQAEHGLLCAWCWNRLTDAFDAAPGLIAHLHEISDPHAQNRPLDTDVRPTGDPAESTVLPAPWLDADELEGLIASWALLVLEEHPAQPMRGPWAAPWHGNITAWLIPHLPWCAGQEWAGEMRREIVEYVTTLRHRHPTADDVEPARRLNIPCPRCNLLSLTYTPPRWAGHPFRVECTDPDCARVFSEDEWDRFKALALDTSRGGRTA